MKTINLNELTLDNIGQWPQAVKYIVILIVMLLIMGAGYQFLISPNIAQYAQLQKQELILKQSFEEKQGLASSLDLYRAQLYKMEALFQEMLKHLPAENEMPGLLEDLSKTGVESGLVFTLFAPQQEIKHDFYIELPINIEVIGTYRQLAIFVSRVAQMSRIVTIHDLTISLPADKTSSAQTKQPGPDLLVMKLTAKIYRYRTP